MQNEIAERPLPSLPYAENDDDGAGIREYFELLYQGRWVIFLITLFAILLAGIYVFLAPPVYKADALLRIDKNKAFLNDPLRGAGRSEDGESPRAHREVEILHSRLVLGQVVDNLHLAISAAPKYFPYIGEAIARRHDSRQGVAEPWWGLDSYAWGGENVKVSDFNVPNRYLGQPFNLVALPGNRYHLIGAEEVLLAEGQVGETLEVDMSEPEPLVLKVSELTARPGTYFNLSRRSRLGAINSLAGSLIVKETGKDTDVVSIEIKGQKPELLAQEVNDIATTYVREAVAWESAEAEQKLRFLGQQLPTVKERLESSEDALNAFRQKHSAIDISSETGVLFNQIAQIETLAIQLKQKEVDLRQHFAESHPQIVTIKAQLGRVDRMLANLSERIKGLPRTQQDMGRLSRDVQVNTELYTSLLNSAQEQGLVAAGAIGNSRIVDYAVTPESQVSPRPRLIFIIAGLFGSFSGMAAVFLPNSLRRRVSDASLVEHRLGFPVYATVPHSKGQETLARTPRRRRGHPAVLAYHRPDDVSVESLRGLRTTLYSALKGMRNNVLMVCSPGPGMGKSFISANLAAVLASAEKRVLLIDGDLRNGRLHDVFSAPQEPGLADLISGSATSTDVISRIPAPRVDFIPRGCNASNPAELLMHRHLRESLEDLKEHYDHIIIDSPPVLSVTDAALIGQLAGATIMVIKEGGHTVQELELSIRRLQQAGVKPHGFLINDMKQDSPFYPYYVHTYAHKN
jgi:tyrosine-protein kinase Etk/Wzc